MVTKSIWVMKYNLRLYSPIITHFQLEGSKQSESSLLVVWHQLGVQCSLVVLDLYPSSSTEQSADTQEELYYLNGTYLPPLW